jgi:hypothetical protein
MLSRASDDRLEGGLQAILDFLKISWFFCEGDMVLLSDGRALRCIHALPPKMWNSTSPIFVISLRASASDRSV